MKAVANQADERVDKAVLSPPERRAARRALCTPSAILSGRSRAGMKWRRRQEVEPELQQDFDEHEISLEQGNEMLRRLVEEGPHD